MTLSSSARSAQSHSATRLQVVLARGDSSTPRRFTVTESFFSLNVPGVIESGLTCDRVSVTDASRSHDHGPGPKLPKGETHGELESAAPHRHPIVHK